MKLTKTLPALVALGIAGASSLAGSVPTLAGSSFDGSWKVLVKADPGRCSDRYAVAISVANGRVSYVGMPAGKVGANGAIRLSISDVHASGALLERTGNGRWRSTTCNGSWVARKV